jgi:uncharacterized membrane protein YeaQ/YmgE (transglycosylase-associated protein family)
MTLITLLLLLLIAGIAGAIGQSIAGYSLGGCLVSAAVGLIGALIGAWLSAALGLPELFVVQVGTWSFPVIWAIIGATIFAAAVGLLTRGRAPRV